MKFENNEICSIFPIDSLVFYVWDQNFEFLTSFVRIDPFSPKNQNFDPEHKIPKNKLEKLNRFHIIKSQNFDFLKVPYFCRINSGPIFYSPQKPDSVE